MKCEEQSKTRSGRFRKKRAKSRRKKRILRMSCKERGEVREYWQKMNRRRKKKERCIEAQRYKRSRAKGEVEKMKMIERR